MLLGMPTLIELKAPEDCARLCARLGLDFVELNMNLPEYQPGMIDAGRLESAAREYGVTYSIHLDENLNISDFNPYVAQSYRRTVQEAIALADRLGAGIINMHLPRGVYFTLPSRKVYLFEEYKSRYIESFLRLREDCERRIGGSGISICVENCEGFTDFQLQALGLLLQSPVFALTLDTGHSHSAGGRDEDFILKNKAKLRHIHMHDAVAQQNHLPLGDGEIELEKYFSLAREQGCGIVLETKTVEGLHRCVQYIGTLGL